MKPKNRRRFGCLFKVIGVLILLLGLFVGAVAVCFFIALQGCPELDLEKVVPHSYRSELLDADGEHMRYLLWKGANRDPAKLEEIPDCVREAFIAIEDKRFYDHNGVDARGTLRALFRDALKGGLAQGGSTITQQLIKNSYFNVGMDEKNWVDKVQRKFREWWLAWTLERVKDKDFILENYLNTINLGGVLGVEAASLTYFGCHVSELTVPEAAVLAAIPKSPSEYNPRRNEDKNRTRQRLVLRNMYAQGYLSEGEYNDATAAEDSVYETIRRVRETETNPGEVYSWFEDAVLDAVEKDLKELGYSQDECETLIYSGGLTVETTQNADIQRVCEEQLKQQVHSDADFTVVVMNPYNGAVLGVIGAGGEKTVNRANVLATRAVRQPASTFKVLGEYAEALERGGMTLGTVFEDRVTAYSGGGGKVRNSDGVFRGRLTMRQAIAYSTNTIALQCFQQVGMDAVWDRLSLFGFSHLDDSDKVEALSLGGTHNGVTNLELTAAYAALANGGTYHEPYFYTRVLDSVGNELLVKRPEVHRAVSRETAALLTAAMMETLRSGTGKAAYFPGYALAGKTGTSNSKRDLWFVGYSPDYACGVWSGYQSPKAQTLDETKELWREIMRRIQPSTPTKFQGPVGMEQRLICTKCGKLAVPGLCDSTIQDDMTCLELFAPGTIPTERCDCHVGLRVCVESEQIANEYCPRTEYRVFLKTYAPDTIEEYAVAPRVLCTRHQPPRPVEPTPAPGYSAPSYPTPVEPAPNDPTPEPVEPAQNAWPEIGDFFRNR